MQIRRILLGPQAATYLPFAEAQIRKLRRLRGEYFRQKYEVPGYVIRIYSDPLRATVWIQQTSDFYLEYQTTGMPVGTQTSTLSGVYPKAATIALAPDGKGGVLASMLDHARVANTGTSSPLHRPQQVQLLDENAHYANKVSGHYQKIVMDSWTPPNPFTGLSDMYYPAYDPYHLTLFQAPINQNRDVHYDIPTFVIDGKTAVQSSTLRNATVDWPRSSILRTVVDGARTREFVITVDAFDQVSAYPTSEITTQTSDGDGQPLQNVDALYVQTARVSFPGWVYAKTERFLDYYTATPNTGDAVFPEYDWQLHPDGTKMAAVVLAREEATFDATFYDNIASEPSGISAKFYCPTADNWALTNQFIMGAGAMNGPFTTDLTRHLYASGLLEVTINISLTGDNPENYTLTLTTATKRDPTDDATICTLLTGYAYQDIRSRTSPKTQTDVARGDLCVLDVEVYGRASDGSTPDYAGRIIEDTCSFLSLKNLTQNKEIRTFNAENDRKSVPGMVSGMNRIIAYDMKTLSFAICHELNVYQYKSGATYSEGGPPGLQEGLGWFAGTKQAKHFGVAIYTLNRWRHTFYPDSIDGAIKARIDAVVDRDGRADMVASFGAISLMPLNDLRDFTDTTLAKIRRQYDTYDLGIGFTFPSGPPTTDFALSMFQSQSGLAYTDSSAFTPPTFAEMNWFYGLMSQGRSYGVPWPMLRLSNPKPGWYMYQDQLMRRFRSSPWTAFFTHPNGSWGFFCADLIYNKAGVAYESPDSTHIVCTQALDAANFEHCIFDHIYIGPGVNTTFLATYNKSIDGAITDSSTTMATSDLRGTFSVVSNVLNDSQDGTVSYDGLQLTWGGHADVIAEPAYFHGTRTLTGFGEPVFDPRWGAYAIAPTTGQAWLKTTLDAAEQPNAAVASKRPTFSSMVMIDG